MNNDAIIAYGVFLMSFLLLDIYILLKTNRDIVRKGEYIWFSALIVSHILYLVSSTVWTLCEYDLLKLDRPMLMIVCTLSLWAVTNCATSFFLFVAERLQLTYLRSGVGIWLRQLPAAVSSVLILSSPASGLVFKLDESGYLVYGNGYVPTIMLSSTYLLFVAGVAAVHTIRNRTTHGRRSNGALLGSVLIILLFIAIDGLLSKASILPVAIFAVILIIFITMQEANINSDALTGMNNRRKAEDYLSELLSGASSAEPIYLYIADVDNFKKINDTYGHIEGDEALILCSRALKRVVAAQDGFAARYGGDEFLFVWQRKKGSAADPEAPALALNETLHELTTDKPYALAMSAGYVACTDPHVPLQVYIAQADDMLYRKKEAVHAAEERE